MQVPPPPPPPSRFNEAIVAIAWALIVAGGIGILLAFVLVKLGYGQSAVGMMSRASQAVSKRLRRRKRL